MTPEDAEEYTQALGQVVAGGYRQVALGQRLGVPQALGISTEEWVMTRLGGYVKLSLPERREAVRELLAPINEGGDGLTTRQAAQVLGVSHNTVAKDARPVTDVTAEPEPPEWDEDDAVTDVTAEPEPLPAATTQAREPTLGELAPPDLELPPGRLSPIEKGSFALGQVHVLTKFSPTEMAEATIGLARPTADPTFAESQASKFRQLGGWASRVAEEIDRLTAGRRLQVVR